ncbi:MAG: Spy/CpxP family protein refolding chaperone [Proteobacteria bacterium]|nr:Spy/CpxP family protein refolding chaperone [Pseudomonadota bacterium]
MHRTTPLALALALTLSLTTAAPIADAQAAQRAGAERRDGDRDRERERERERERRATDDRDYEGVGLNDAQRGQLRAIDEENRVEMARLEEREGLARRALEGLVPGAAGYAAARERYEEAQRQTTDARNRHRDRRDGVLTPDQRRTVGDRRTNRGERGVDPDRSQDRRDDRRDKR